MGGLSIKKFATQEGLVDIIARITDKLVEKVMGMKKTYFLEYSP